MRVCIIGGIFDKSKDYRARHAISPETVLATGLRNRGWEVVVAGHRGPLPDGYLDLIHVHHFGRAALRLAAASSRSPFVFTTHDPFAMNGLPVGWRRRFTDGFVLRKTDVVVALSHAEREFLAQCRAIHPKRIAIIPNGIDTAVFDRVPVEPDHNLLLFVGQLKEFKGLHYLLEALPAVRAQYPHVKLRIVYQTGALLDRYRAQAERLRLNECVQFAGPETAAGLARLYSSAALVVAPSLGECLSTVVLEAMCCGAAVIATDVGGIREQLDPDTGVIIPARDPWALAKAINNLLPDADRRRHLGQSARQKARIQFSIRKMIDRHIRLYENLLNSNERAA